MNNSLNNKVGRLPACISKIFAAVLAITAATSLTGCSDIKDEDRFIELPPVEAKRVVLIEEFTGQRCVKCPDAHDVVADLLQQYPENLISVSMHGGSLAYNEDKLPKIGLANADSEKYYAESKVEAPPAAVINRTTGVINSPMWESAIRKELEKPASVDLSVAYFTPSPEGKALKIGIDISPWQTMEANLQVWIVESGITGLQLTKQGNKMDYVHNHVFRAAVNGHDGEPVKLTTRQPVTCEYTIAIRDDEKCQWNAANLSVVAFLYNDSGVLQATHAPLTPLFE